MAWIKTRKAINSTMTNEDPQIPAIEVRNLTVSYGPKPALLDISFLIEKGLLVGVIGPNGAGKSTLIKAILGLVRRDVGEVRLMGMSADNSRGLVAYVPQKGSVDWDFPITVEEVTMMGRYGYIPWHGSPAKEDRRIVAESLEMVRLENFRKRQIGQLSGGQQQRLFIARALAQGSEILLLDEPFAGVDAATEKAILELLERARNTGRTLVVVHHDLATAGRYFDRLLLIKQRLFAYGPPRAVLSEELLTEVYEGKLHIFSKLAR